MNKSFAIHVLAASMTLAFAGCTSPQKQAKGKSAASSNPLMSSAKKVQQDVSQTGTDLSAFESEAKLSR